MVGRRLPLTRLRNIGIDGGLAASDLSVMDVDAALARSGLRPVDGRVLGWTAMIGIVTAAAAGSAAPTITTGTVDDIWSVDATPGPTELRVVAVFLASITIGFHLVSRFVEHRWPWPIGARIERPAGARPNVAGVLAIIVSGSGSARSCPSYRRHRSCTGSSARRNLGAASLPHSMSPPP